VVVQAGRDPVTRKRKQLSGSVGSESEAVSLEAELRRRVAEADGPCPTIGLLVEEWWASSPRLAASTRSNYRATMDSHVLPLLGHRPVSEIRPRLVAQFLRHLQSDKALSPGTVRKVRTVLSSVISYAVTMEYVESNAVMKVPPPERSDARRVAPTVEEAAAILVAAERHDRAFLTYPWVAAEEGGRRGETLALRWGGIDVERRVLTIDSTVTRGDDGVQVRPRTKTNKPRRVAVSSMTLALLAEHRAAAKPR
jgi:integrase